VRHLVDGTVLVEEAGGLHRNLRVLSSTGASYFLKQSRDRSTRGDRHIPVEAELYRRVSRDDWLATLRPFVPACHHYDHERDLLVLDLVADGRGVYDLVGEDDPLALPPIGEQLAAVLAALHAALLPPDAALEGSVFRARGRPWVLDIARPVPEALWDLAPAQLQLLRLLQRDQALAAQLADLRAGWTDSNLIHGDIKWSNILAGVEPESKAPARLTLVDWELARIGDPAWDVGSVFHSYLAHCVAAAPREDATAEDAANAFAGALPAMQVETRRFWEAYARHSGLTASNAARLLDRATRYCGARLLQSTYEWCQTETAIPRPAAGILQLALNLLDRPAAGQAIVLGLTAPGSLT
jgi:hypothetical protein